MFYASQLMAKHGIQAVFSDRQGGVSMQPFDSLNLGYELGDTFDNVEKNLKILCDTSGLPLPHQSKQVHGAEVLYCSGVGSTHNDEADILIATEKGVAVAVRTADCLPMLLLDKEAGVAAAVHAGWRGTVAKVGQVAVQAMLARGARVERIIASLGPCIQGCCFETSREVYAQLSGSCGQEVGTLREQKYYADLAETNQAQLLGVGIKAENIEVGKACTSCDESVRYFSYRRDCGKTGRQLSVIHLT